MPYIKGVAADFPDLVAQLCTWVSNAAIHGADAWEVMRQEPWPKGTIIKAHGWESGEHFYIGLMPAEIIKDTTYKEWILQREVITREFIWNPYCLNAKPEEYETVIDQFNLITCTKKDKNGNIQNQIKARLDKPEIFQKSAKPLFLGAFKQYAEELDWHEQAGGNKTKVKIKDAYYYVQGDSKPKPFSPPPYPGVGYPAMCMDYEGPLNGFFEWWAIKDRHRIVIVTNNSGFWDVAHLGFMEPYHKPDEYACPLCVVGGTSGVRTAGEMISLSGSYASPVTGVRFDYSTGNWQLGRGLPTSAGTPWDSSSLTFKDDERLSQVQLMLPDGTWQSFYNWLFEEGKVAIPSSSGPPSYEFCHGKPAQNENIKHFIRPCFSNVGKTKNLYNANADDFTYQLEPLELVQGTLFNNVQNMLGKLWRITWPSGTVLRFGEFTFSGKKYLVVPNGFEGRAWYIQHGRTYTMDADDLFEEQKEIYEQTIGNSACVIRLED